VKAPIAFPFLRPRPDRVSVLWNFKPEPNEHEQIPDWDVNTGVAFTALANVDRRGVLDDCQLPDNAPLGLSVTWYSPGTTLRGLSKTIPLGPNTNGAGEYVLSAELAPNELAESVQLALSLHLLTGDLKTSHSLAPRIVGSVLWRESKNLILEGQAARFPIEARSFENDSLLPKRAAWYLDWTADAIGDPFMGTVRLLVNDSHPTIHQFLRGQPEEAGHQVIASILKFDVACQLVEGMLRSDDFIGNRVEMPVGSVGRHVRELLEICFPGESVSSLASRLTTDRAMFMSLLQEALGFLSMDK
jgi:hypothetical protein